MAEKSVTIEKDFLTLKVGSNSSIFSIITARAYSSHEPRAGEVKSPESGAKEGFSRMPKCQRDLQERNTEGRCIAPLTPDALRDVEGWIKQLHLLNHHCRHQSSYSSCLSVGPLISKEVHHRMLHPLNSGGWGGGYREGG